MENTKKEIKMNYTKEQIDFLKSLDFMRLGQALNREQWQAAAMTIRRLDMKAKEVELLDFERNFTGIRQCINRKDGNEAKQILAVVINRRAKYLNALSIQKKEIDE